jgi:hypothetical protein
MMDYFPAFRTQDADELLKSRPFAFILLWVIARRARYTNGFNEHNLSYGEAFLGDHEACGMSEQNYKTAKKFLAKHKFATFRPTNKGTIAKLCDARVFWMKVEQCNDQNNAHLTDAQRTPNEQLTTNNKENKENKGKKVHKGPEFDSAFEEFWNCYPKKMAKAAARKAFPKVTVGLDVLIAAVERSKQSREWQKDDGQFVPYASTWLNGRRWEDHLEIDLPKIATPPTRNVI